MCMTLDYLYNTTSLFMERFYLFKIILFSAKRQATLSIQEKQLEQLKERQNQYKKAALEAKTHDDKELALKYMRVIKGMNPMIQAATNGLPVDMGQVGLCWNF